MILFVHESEVDEYKRLQKCEVRSIPDELMGKGMGVIRNFILDHTEDDEVLMVDDDIAKIQMHENLSRFDVNGEHLKQFVLAGFRLCREAETVLWGMNVDTNGMSYREYTPFSFLSPVLGPFFGIVKSDLRFDENLGLKEDYDYVIQVLRKYRRVLRFNKFYYIVDHLKKLGGCSVYRTTQAERDQYDLFFKKWGSRIVKPRTTVHGNASINPLIQVPIRGI